MIYIYISKITNAVTVIKCTVKKTVEAYQLLMLHYYHQDYLLNFKRHQDLFQTI
jgi:hypothetical protein